MSVLVQQWLLVSAVGFPAGAVLVLAVLARRGREQIEGAVATVVVWAFAVTTMSPLLLGCFLLLDGSPARIVSLGLWFAVGNDEFHLTLVGDRLSIPFGVLAALLGLLIAVLSRRYLHKDPGYPRFYLLLTLFVAGVELVVLAGALEVALVGWEIAGLSSALLIAYFHERRRPVEHGLRAFLTYRACDTGLIGAVVWLHHSTGTTTVAPAVATGGWLSFAPPAPGDAAVIGLLLLWASMGKSAQLPLSGWLPRAMEGPTPSSALCYGAISVSLGPYLLLRTESIWAQVSLVHLAIVAVGALTAVYATVVGRVQTDIKSSLAFASMTQISVILVEVGLGLHGLALVHLVAHAALRSAQILRAPSLLHDHHHVEQLMNRPSLPRTGTRLARLIPQGTRAWLYRYALERGYIDTLLLDHVVGRFVRLVRRADALDDRWADLLSGGRSVMREKQL